MDSEDLNLILGSYWLMLQILERDVKDNTFRKDVVIKAYDNLNNVGIEGRPLWEKKKRTRKRIP